MRKEVCGQFYKDQFLREEWVGNVIGGNINLSKSMICSKYTHPFVTKLKGIRPTRTRGSFDLFSSKLIPKK